MIIQATLPSVAFAEEAAPEVVPWGLIKNGKGVPVN